MSVLKNKKILLGITGSIAAYKSTELIRKLSEEEALLQVVMTESAKSFISPLTLQALSKSKIRDSLWDIDAEAAMGHIELAQWAEIILIAPASANIIARFAHGLADDLLTTLVLASPSMLFLAPAMNQYMWQHPAVQHNIQLLIQRKVEIIGPVSGYQACGMVGEGRMSEIEEIIKALKTKFSDKILQDLHLLITAGATKEPIDSVRFISNHSSGKMGYALAEAAYDLGAKVTVVSGNSSLPQNPNIAYIFIETAEEMYQAVHQHISEQDIFIAAAAVSDYRPQQAHPKKIKKTEHDTLTLTLVANPDILTSVANLENKPFCVGFAAETEHLITYAKEKLQRKNLDMIIANWVNQEGIGFNSDENAVEVIWKQGQQSLIKQPKKELAYEILKLIYQQYQKTIV